MAQGPAQKNVSVIFATQSLSDIAARKIAPAVIESCPSRIFLPNDRALEPQQRKAYAAFGLNDRQVEIIAQATPKRDYYFQSRSGNRLFDLSLGPVALAFCGASSKDDLKAISEIAATSPKGAFPARWLEACGLNWAAGLITDQPQPRQGDALCAAE